MTPAPVSPSRPDRSNRLRLRRLRAGRFDDMLVDNTVGPCRRQAGGSTGSWPPCEDQPSSHKAKVCLVPRWTSKPASGTCAGRGLEPVHGHDHPRWRCETDAAVGAWCPRGSPGAAAAAGVPRSRSCPEIGAGFRRRFYLAPWSPGIRRRWPWMGMAARSPVSPRFPDPQPSPQRGPPREWSGQSSGGRARAPAVRATAAPW